MDLAITDGKNVGWSTLSQSLMLQWLAVSDIVSDLLCIDIAGIIAS
jgi:hypothetical protein